MEGEPPAAKQAKGPIDDGYFIKTTSADRERIQDTWTEFFFEKRISFNVADSKRFNDALNATCPGISPPDNPLLTRRKLAGSCMDKVHQII